MPSWKKVIISGSDAALNSLDITQDLTVDTNTLHVDSSNNRVGIGTTSPGAKFHVSGGGFDVYTDYSATNPSIGLSSLKKTSGFNALVVGRSHSTNDSAALRFNYVGANNTSNYLSLGFYANDDLLVIKPSGNVGIGTTSPSEKLDVSGNVNTSGTYNIGGNIFAQISSGDFIVADGGLVSNNAAGYTYLRAGGTQRIYIDNFTSTIDITGSLNVGSGTDINLVGGGNLETNGGNVNTTGGSINIGGGAVNGTIPGSAVNVDIVTATIKNFVIDHPTPEKEGYKLRHSSLEGPESGVYFRGKSTSNIIDLPDYWVDLVEEESITVNLTSFGSPCQHYIEDIRDNQVIIGCACGTPNYHFTVYGERKDVEKLVVEYKEEKYL